MASNIQFVTELPASVPVASSAGNFRLFLDITDGKFKLKDSLGNVVPIATSSGGGAGGFTRIPIGTTKTVAVDEQVIGYGELKIQGTFKLDGSYVSFKMPEQVFETPVVSSGPYNIPNYFLIQVKVDPSGGALTVVLPARGSTGQEVVIKNIAASANIITVDGNGNRMDGVLSRVLNSGFEVLRLSRKRNQQWSVES